MKFDLNKTKLKFGELYSGPGGLSLGAIKSKVIFNNKQYGFEHSWASDYDKNTCETYTKNICPNHPDKVFCEDVHNLDTTKLDPIDIFAYGFPCNDFSVVGEQKGINGKYGPLYSYGLKIIKKFKPYAFVAENVSGLTSANSGDTFKQILKQLEETGDGYCLTAHLYRAEDYGVPQTRHRIIIVGIRKDFNLKFKVPSPTTLNKPVSVETALKSIPLNAANNDLTNMSKIVVERLKYIKPGENAWTAKLPSHLTLNVKSAKLSQIYKRLDPSKPSYTITGSGGGGTHGYHWIENRALTNRERARIQTFPDNFVFFGSKESVRKQIGMAVPPHLSQIIFTSILKTFLEIPYSYIPANKYNSLG